MRKVKTWSPMRFIALRARNDGAMRDAEAVVARRASQ
jgi:hypothetical protein